MDIAERAAFDVVSPVDGRVYARRLYAGSREIEAALARAEAAAKGWARTPIAERIAVIARFGEEMARRAPALAEAVAWQMGRPLWQADETARLKLVGDLTAEAAVALADEEFAADPGIRRFTRYVALGVTLSICAWNYPVAMLGYLVSGPLVAGNVVLFKHSPQTPLIGDIAAEAFAAAGAPPGVFQALDMTHPDAERVIGSGRLRSVHFIGSVPGGRRVHTAAAGTFTHVHLELGGKDPAYIRPDADLDKAIPLLIEGSYSNAGQSCCSVERIYVHEAIAPRFIEAFAAQAAEVTIDHPIDARPYIGPVVSARAAQTIRTHIGDAVARGARRVLAPGRSPTSLPGEAYVEPEMLVGTDHTMTVMREETFGPVVAIQTVRDDAEAIRLMNDSDYGLSASVWTADSDTGLKLLDEIEAGTVYLNRCDHADLYLPWGGLKNSGLGRVNGREGLRQASDIKAFHVRTEFA
ncbi:aldehyde dehydrogenase family protein [Taklimakanibacter lacteus]|uniref:aldehyde dehydrogenase family protein n=1 Tax=Taklimakanibacter lacteus TaxID=2268456 RepID=UPI000E669BB4